MLLYFSSGGIICKFGHNTSRSACFYSNETQFSFYFDLWIFDIVDSLSLSFFIKIRVHNRNNDVKI